MGLTVERGTGSVSLSWSAPATGPAPTSYAISRDGAKLLELPAGTGFTNVGLDDDVRYCYVVTSMVGNVEGGQAQACAEVGGTGEKPFKRGDTDGDGKVLLNDVIVTLGYLYLGGAAPKCFDSADSDDTGVLDLADAIFTLTYLYLGGALPKDPGPFSCGSDKTPDGTKNPFPPCDYPAKSCQ